MISETVFEERIAKLSEGDQDALREFRAFLQMTPDEQDQVAADVPIPKITVIRNGHVKSVRNVATGEGFVVPDSDERFRK